MAGFAKTNTLANSVPQLRGRARVPALTRLGVPMRR
jgi:hypothetical protein